MICERCGKELPDKATFCPFCGTPTPSAEASPATSYGAFPADEYENPYDPQPSSTYEQGYQSRPSGSASSSSYYPPPEGAGYEPRYHVPPYQSPPPINVTVINNFPAAPKKNNAALITEIILSLFSLYGVGWIMAGETTIGVILMVLSIVVFWPLEILIAVFTLGFGIFVCNLPMATVGIIVNALLLNSRLERQVRQARPSVFSSTYQAQHMQPPPRRVRPQ
jgi:zinc-ribbon domain